MQGDLHRARQKDWTKERPCVSKILTGVDDMRIQDALDNSSYKLKYTDEDNVGSLTSHTL